MRGAPCIPGQQGPAGGGGGHPPHTQRKSGRGAGGQRVRGGGGWCPLPPPVSGQEVPTCVHPPLPHRPPPIMEKSLQPPAIHKHRALSEFRGDVGGQEVQGLRSVGQQWGVPGAHKCGANLGHRGSVVWGRPGAAVGGSGGSEVWGRPGAQGQRERRCGFIQVGLSYSICAGTAWLRCSDVAKNRRGGPARGGQGLGLSPPSAALRLYPEGSCAGVAGSLPPLRTPLPSHGSGAPASPSFRGTGGGGQRGCPEPHPELQASPRGCQLSAPPSPGWTDPPGLPRPLPAGGPLRWSVQWDRAWIPQSGPSPGHHRVPGGAVLPPGPVPPGWALCVGGLLGLETCPVRC
ncbi:collagen alpha-1(III) chain-like [Malaclemys terrapin pileata]|uniref:collagen alpha-1(III) chain-like n=1 Tax=Malaclemys terrapin pileata TaxID=2991368 RepID=UPI0023A7F514|nr:collagen alpha-1(III) chain-like [Malaclemys terrapin pileata]